MLEAVRQHVQLVISDLVLEETERNLREFPERRARALSLFQQFYTDIAFETVAADEEAVRAAAKYTEAKDAAIIAAAVEAGVDYRRLSLQPGPPSPGRRASSEPAIRP